MELAETTPPTSIPFKKTYLVSYIVLAIGLLSLAGYWYQDLKHEEINVGFAARRLYAVKLIFILATYELLSLSYRLFFCANAIELDESRIQMQFGFRKISVPWVDIEKIEITKNKRVIGGQVYLNLTTNNGKKYRYLLLFSGVTSKELARIIKKYSGIDLSIYADV